jgi:hypothetical protein
MKQSSSMMHEYKLQLFEIVTFFPILTEEGTPVGREAAV